MGRGPGRGGGGPVGPGPPCATHRGTRGAGRVGRGQDTGPGSGSGTGSGPGGLGIGDGGGSGVGRGPGSGGGIGSGNGRGGSGRSGPGFGSGGTGSGNGWVITASHRDVCVVGCRAAPAVRGVRRPGAGLARPLRVPGATAATRPVPRGPGCPSPGRPRTSVRVPRPVADAGSAVGAGGRWVQRRPNVTPRWSPPWGCVACRRRVRARRGRCPGRRCGCRGPRAPHGGAGRGPRRRRPGRS